jgi:hypothetical protein
MASIVPFPNSTWTVGLILQDPLYRQLDYSNPMYCLWKWVLASGDALDAGWGSSYPRFAADMLNQLGDMRGDAGFMRLPEIMRVEVEVEYQLRLLRTPVRGKKRKEGFANRAPSFRNPTLDGGFAIGGRKYANQYNYNKYRQHVNYVGPNGERLIEDIDFHLDANGVVRKGPPTDY